MKRLYLLLALLFAAAPAFAQSEGAVTPGTLAPRSNLAGCTNSTSAPTVGNGQQVAVQCDTSGRLLITTGTTSGGSISVVGPTGNNVDGVVPTATGNVPSDGYNYGFNSATNAWDRLHTAVSAGSNMTSGVLTVLPTFYAGATNYNIAWNASNIGDGAGAQNGVAAIQGFNGNAYDRIRTLGTTSLGILGIGISPNPDVVGSITPVVSATAGSQSLVLKAAPGNVYQISADNSSQVLSGKLILFNATAAPATGALASNLVLDCINIMTGGLLGGTGTISYLPGPPVRAATGAVLLLSSSPNCNTWTPSTMSGFLRGMVQ